MAGSAIWTVPQDFVTGEITTAAKLNANVRDNFTYLGDIGYVEFTSNVSVTGNTMVDIVSLPALTYAATLVVIEFFCTDITAGASGNLEVHLRDGATDLGQFTVMAANDRLHGPFFQRKLTPSAASHTYKVSAINAVAQTSTVFAGAGGAGTRFPGFIRVRGIPS